MPKDSIGAEQPERIVDPGICRALWEELIGECYLGRELRNVGLNAKGRVGCSESSEGGKERASTGDRKTWSDDRVHEGMRGWERANVSDELFGGGDGGFG